MPLQNEIERIWLNSIHRSSPRENYIYHSLTGVLMNSLINDFLENRQLQQPRPNTVRHVNRIYPLP